MLSVCYVNFLTDAQLAAATGHAAQYDKPVLFCYLCFKGLIMVIATRLTDDSFEQWLGQINSACGRFCAKTLAPGFAGAIQEFTPMHYA